MKPPAEAIAAALDVGLRTQIGLTVLEFPTPYAKTVDEALARGAEAVAAGLGAGKKVAGLPLATCHWSQSITIEKPKTTQRMERRMSFMRTSWIEGET